MHINAVIFDLDPTVRAAISSFSIMKQTDEGLAALKADLESGAWENRYGKVLQQSALDCGYRLLIANAQ